MNTEVFEILKKNNWSPDKKTNRQQIIDAIKLENYEPFDSVIDFLESFYNLKILFKNKKNGLENDDINFSIEAAAHLIYKERVFEDYEPRINKKLCLIGSAYREHFVLLMSSDGFVYGGYDDYLVLIENSGIAAIEAIILDKDFMEIP